MNKLSLFDKFLDTFDINMIYNFLYAMAQLQFLVNTFDINMIYNVKVQFEINLSLVNTFDINMIYNLRSVAER